MLLVKRQSYKISEIWDESLSFIVMYYQEQSRRSNKNDTIHFYEAFIRFARNGAKWQDALNNRETQRLQ